jgi:hypothetical protein
VRFIGCDVLLSGASFALLAMTVHSSGCLPIYAPSIRPEHHHAGLERDANADDCLSCHMAESSFREMRIDDQAAQLANIPLVMDWMVEDGRGCLHCHQLHSAQ